MSDQKVGKQSHPRNHHNIKRQYRDAVIDWSKDAQGNSRVNSTSGHLNEKQIRLLSAELAGNDKSAQNVVDYFKCETPQDCE